jgi:hypothetical protein
MNLKVHLLLMAMTTAAMMPANIGVLSGAAAGAASAGAAGPTERPVSADDA